MVYQLPGWLEWHWRKPKHVAFRVYYTIRYWWAHANCQLPYWLTCPLAAFRIVWLRHKLRTQTSRRLEELCKGP